MNNNINRNFSSIEDFVWDEDFRQWVLNKDNDLDEFWSDWESMHQDKAEEIATAKQIIQSMNVKHVPVSDTEINMAIKDILAKTTQKVKPEPIPTIKASNNWYRYAGMAATLLVVMSVTLLFFVRYNSHSSISYKDLVKESGSELTEQANTNPQAQEIQLADGSRITLQKNARISYAPKFNSYATRKIYLTGQATFEVAKNPAKPFFVYTNGLITKVLGTKFTITSNEGDKNATVEVMSGIVSVFSLVDKKSQDEMNTKKLNSLILTRNQKASFSKDERTLIASVVEKPVGVNEQSFDQSFTDAPLKKVFKTVEDSYGIPVIYDEKIFANRTLTANLGKTTMYQKLSIICKTINARYEINDGKIVIYANALQDRP
ncbi:MAG: FecR family protein [Bacteroidota bacterium]